MSSTSRDLKEFREVLLEEIGKALDGVGMEFFVPKGVSSHKDCIDYLKRCDIVIFIITAYYGTLIENCILKEDCKAKCPMKEGSGRISYTHCEYKTTIAEEILHQTYFLEKDWALIEDLQKFSPDELYINNLRNIDKFKEVPAIMFNKYVEVSKAAYELKNEVSKEAYGKIEQIKIPETINLIRKNLANQITEWYTDKKFNFNDFCNRIEELNEIIENIEGKVEVYGIGGVGKTALIQVALLIEKLKGKLIISVGTSKTYASGSGFEDFRIKCKNDQFRTESKDLITLNDIINAFAETNLIGDPDDLKKCSVDEIIETLSECIRKEANLILFIDDFHLATVNVRKLVKRIDHIIFSSRKNTYIARKEICITGVDEEERENLINIFSRKELPEGVRESIKKISEGHPVSTELLVKNYQRIDFNKIIDFDLQSANETQVEDFYERVINEIFSSNKDALILLKNLAVLNIDLPTNINQESVLNSNNTENVKNSFYELIDTVMLKKKNTNEGVYEFYFKHIQDYLENNASQQNHEAAIRYYEKKKELSGENIDDSVEILFHKVKSNPNKKMIDEFVEIYKKVIPVNYGFKRLIDVGEELKNLLTYKDKVLVLKYLGNLYSTLRRFNECETRYFESLKTLKIIEDEDPYFYSYEFGNLKYNLGQLYYNLNRFNESKLAYNEALEIYQELAKNNPDKHLEDVADTRHALGTINWKLNNLDLAEKTFLDTLDIKKTLVDQDPEKYLPKMVTTLNNLGILYDDLRRFEKAEEMYHNALNIEKKLAKENPELYLPSIAVLQNNLGSLYRKLKKFDEAEKKYLEALNARRKLAESNPETYLPKVAVTLNNLGIVYEDRGKYKEAEESYNKALKIEKELAEQDNEAYLPLIADTKSNLGTLYQNMNNFEKAEKMYLEALHIKQELAEINPKVYKHTVAKTQNDLGTLYQNIEKYNEAEQMYLSALKVTEDLKEKNTDIYLPDISETLLNLGILYWNMKQFDKAEEMCIKALNGYKFLMQENPEMFLLKVSETLYKLGSLYNKMERFDHALIKFDEIIEINPNYIDAWAQKGYSLHNLKRFDEAETCNDKVLSIDPHYSIAWYNKACIEAIRYNVDRSVEYLAKAINLDKKYITMAKSDIDFDPIRKKKKFSKLVSD
ncbi:MAG: tetratricopeptide repeat protein [Promethearchaeota archaeon]